AAPPRLPATLSRLVARLPRLPATSGASVSGGVTRFHSRPDLLAPQVVIDRPMQSGHAGVVVTESHSGPPQSGPLIVDATGRIVWFNPLAAAPSSPLRAFNVSVQSYRGRPVLCWFQGVVAGGHGVGYGQGHYEIVDSGYQRVARVFAQDGYQGDLHEFFLTPEGSAIFSCYGRARARLRIGGGVRSVPYLFGVVQEVDVASGRLLWQWRSDRHVALSESYAKPVLEPGWIWDYMHLNSIAIDPSDGNLLISGRNTSTCYKVNRRSGKVMWRLGGRHSDFQMGPGTRFHYQHDVNLHPGGVLTLFDNEGGPPRYAAQSRALVLAIDQRRRRARLLHAFHHDPPVYSNALGSVQPLGGGQWFVGWGRATSFSIYSGDGQVLFDGHLSPGSSSYRAFLEPWAGTLAGAPAVAASAGAGAAATVYASWNGATAIADWMVLGGSSPGSLTPLGTAPPAGFETAISLPSVPAYVAVAARDAGGRVLGTSAAASVS
ncbi:MAG: aryl-sulfate sulfotransferase, partial [Acidobacteriota bacterium]|nr:aryl-sulfate sulfotransferase [Acidobacteriota bacterium]